VPLGFDQGLTPAPFEERGPGERLPVQFGR
jgi:hypothetical protein